MNAETARGLPLADTMAIGRLDAHGQAALVRAREVSAGELVEAAIARAGTLGAALNALSFRAFDRARQRARDPLPDSPVAGVPYLLKDSLDYPGMPSRSGSRLTSDTPANWLPPFAARLDEAGLIPIGKSAMPEFGLSPSTEPLLLGPVVNPWSPGRSAGGSSGGAAAAVAAGIVPVAHASDGGGSIRIPASCCGLVGFKPSRAGNVRARRPNVIEDLLCGDGMLSRSVRDVAWFARRLRPADFELVAPPRPERLRIHVVETSLAGSRPHPQVAAVIEKTAAFCARLGHDVSPCRLPLDGKAVLDAFWILWAYLAREVVDQCRVWASAEDVASKLEPWTLGLAGWSDGRTARELEAAVALIDGLNEPMRRVYERCDLVLSPVNSDPPALLGRFAPGRRFDELFRDMYGYIAYSPLQNLAGLPSMSVPLFTTDDGLPTGSMFTGARGSDDLLLGFAAELEGAAPWRDRWPGTSPG